MFFGVQQLYHVVLSIGVPVRDEMCLGRRAVQLFILVLFYAFIANLIRKH
jgi:hypothetical protein